MDAWTVVMDAERARQAITTRLAFMCDCRNTGECLACRNAADAILIDFDAAVGALQQALEWEVALKRAFMPYQERAVAAEARLQAQATYLDQVADRIIEMGGACAHDWLVGVARTLKAANE